MDEIYIKKFDEWHEYVKQLEYSKAQDFFSNREVWWCAIGVNVGSEQDGKNEYFERPVLIIHVINREMLIIAPITSRLKDYPDRVTIDLLGEKSQIVLAQIKMISSKRLLRCISLIKVEAYQKVLLILIHMFSDKGETPQ